MMQIGMVIGLATSYAVNIGGQIAGATRARLPVLAHQYVQRQV
jgi:hypothetical protein